MARKATKRTTAPKLIPRATGKGLGKRGEPPRRGADANDPGEMGKMMPGSGRKLGR